MSKEGIASIVDKLATRLAIEATVRIKSSNTINLSNYYRAKEGRIALRVVRKSPFIYINAKFITTSYCDIVY